MDTPRGDLNHNGKLDSGMEGYAHADWSSVEEYEMFPTGRSEIFEANNDEAHFYVECSGKGACNRASGECKCLPGYTGSACQRSKSSQCCMNAS